MGQILHGSATTAEAVRRAIQHSQESPRALAKRYSINPKTVAKWKTRGSVEVDPLWWSHAGFHRRFIRCPNRARPIQLSFVVR